MRPVQNIHNLFVVQFVRFRRTSSSAAATACFEERCSFQTALERLING